jgi:hypothetical protein
VQDGFYTIDRFDAALGSVKGYIDPAVTGQISAIRIIIPEKSETWIILSEIEFSTEKMSQKELEFAMKIKPPTSNQVKRK